MPVPSLAATLDVQARSHAYSVLLGSGIIGTVGERVAALPAICDRCACAVITDSHVAPLHAEPVLRSLQRVGFTPHLVVFPAGERSKSMEQAAALAETLIGHGLDRHSFVVALGGGVVGDLAGFVSSIYQRGIPYVQIPTTIVSQVDSAIGGKTGVNTVSGKNLLGSFHPPALVLADVTTLDTLPQREFNEGFAEIIKHGVIRDRTLIDRVLSFQRGDEATLLQIICRNLEIKAEIVAADEYERLGIRALLNFGHTVGHGIEQAAGYGRLLHGEAISLGMVAAARLSVERAGLPPADCALIVHCLARYGLPITLEPEITTEAVLTSLRRDKKFEAGAVRFVLTSSIGEARLSAPDEIGTADIRRAVEGLRTMVQ